MAAIRAASWSMISSKVWAPGKNWPCLARNSRTSGSSPPMRRRNQVVEVADHLAIGCEVLEAYRPDRVGHARDVLVEHLTAQPRHELVEALAGVGFEEVVVLQPAQALPDVLGQAVEPVQPLGRHVAQQLAEVAVVRAVVGRIGRLGKPSLDAGTFLRHDLVELSSDVAEHVPQPVPLEGLLPPALEPVHQVAQPGEVGARRVARPPATLHQAAQGLGEVALGHHVVRERVDDLFGIEVGELLAPVPARIPGALRQRVGGVLPLAGARTVQRGQVTRVRRVRGHPGALIGGRSCRPRCVPC